MSSFLEFVRVKTRFCNDFRGLTPLCSRGYYLVVVEVANKRRNGPGNSRHALFPILENAWHEWPGSSENQDRTCFSKVPKSHLKSLWHRRYKGYSVTTRHCFSMSTFTCLYQTNKSKKLSSIKIVQACYKTKSLFWRGRLFEKTRDRF